MKHRPEIWAALVALGAWIAGSGTIALIAWLDFRDRGCAEISRDQWSSTANCSDAVLSMGIGCVALLLGVVAFGFGLKAVRHA